MSDNDSQSTTRARTPPSGQGGSNRDSTQQTTSWDAVIEHAKAHKIDFILAVTRFLTVLCTLFYLIGFPGPAGNRFRQALLLNTATSSLRLHQRMPPPPLSQLSRQYFTDLVREDSFHYLIFPFMFFTGKPMALALLPCTLYAIFNLAVYSITMLDKFGNKEHWMAKISELIAKYQQSLLHTVALSEIALMPLIIIGVFIGNGIMVPVLYYRFITLRYNSSRNAHLKLIVSQMMTLANQYLRPSRA